MAPSAIRKKRAPTHKAKRQASADVLIATKRARAREASRAVATANSQGGVPYNPEVSWAQYPKIKAGKSDIDGLTSTIGIHLHKVLGLVLPESRLKADVIENLRTELRTNPLARRRCVVGELPEVTVISAPRHQWRNAHKEVAVLIKNESSYPIAWTMSYKNCTSRDYYRGVLDAGRSHSIVLELRDGKGGPNATVSLIDVVEKCKKNDRFMKCGCAWEGRVTTCEVKVPFEKND